MSPDILIIIIVTSFVQSIFGVGVLLFGTPLLLLRGYSFIQAVIVLLPISLAINMIQIAKDHRRIDMGFYKKILVYTVPLIVIFLFVVTQMQINISLIVGAFLLFVAAKDYLLKAKTAIQFLIRHEKVYFATMGIIHGMTNLGGSLLTAIVHSKGYDKHVARATVAVSYATFAIFQILTLLVSGQSVDTSYSVLGAYLILGVIVFTLTERLVFMDIKNEMYSRYFAAFLLFSGILLCVRSVF